MPFSRVLPGAGVLAKMQGQSSYPLVIVDAVIRALRSRDFRLLWTGQTVSLLGNFVHNVALPFQILALGGGALELGLWGGTYSLTTLVSGTPLELSARQAFQELLNWVVEEYDLSRPKAALLLAMVANARIAQISNTDYTAYCTTPREALQPYARN